MKQKPYSLEACVTDVSGAVEAFHSGADRLEICSNLETGGMTPALDLVEEVLSKVDIPVGVMIRETPVGFEADDVILNKMIASITAYKTLSIDGFVLGVVKEGRVDESAMTALLRNTAHFPVTFHKAIDSSIRLQEDIEWLNGQSGIDTILTSGGAAHVMDGTGKLNNMQQWSNKVIMPCGGIGAADLHRIHTALSFKWYHGKDLVRG